MPKVSIIVPVYKVEKYIKKCVDSILSQTFTDFEVLLIDDGSPDHSGDICDKYASTHDCIKVFHKNNGGVSSARNVGLENALGDWITFIDADDFVSPTFIEHLYQEIINHPDIDFVQAGCLRYENGIISTENSYNYTYSEDKILLFNKLRGLTFSKMFRRDIILQYNLLFDTQMKVTEDLVFTLDYASYVSKYSFISETGYYYRQREESLTHPNRPRDFNITLVHEFRHLRESILNFINKYKLSNKESLARLKHCAEHLYYVISYLYLNKIDARKRRETLKKTFTKDEIKSLKYIDKKIHRIVLWFYIHNYILIFDCIMSIIYYKKRSKFIE